MQVEVISDHSAEWEPRILVWMAKSLNDLGYQEFLDYLKSADQWIIEGVRFWVTEGWDEDPQGKWTSFELQPVPEDFHKIPHNHDATDEIVTFLCRMEP